MNKVYLFQGLTFAVRRKGAKHEHKTTFKMGSFMVGAENLDEALVKVLTKGFQPVKWYLCTFEKGYKYSLINVAEVRQINADNEKN